MILIRLTLLLLVYRYHHVNSQHRYTEIYQRHCPYTKLCSSTINGTDNTSDRGPVPSGYVSCCLPCYCDSQCRAFSDCCPDASDYNKKDQMQRTVCTNTVYQSLNFKKSDISGSMIKRSIVNSCPDDYNGPLKKKCMEEFEGHPTFDDVTVVSDSHHIFRAYKNKHCAVCNGINNLTRWDVEPQLCIGGMPKISNLLLHQVEQTFINNCQIESRPPSGYPSEYFRCSGLRDKCNDGWILNKNSSSVAEACSKSFSPKFSYSNMLRNVPVFKNVYCYRCNEMDNTKQFPTLCPKRNPQFDGILSSVMLLLTFRSDAFLEAGKSDMSLKGSRLCDERELYDRISVRCRAIKCTWFTSVYKNKCLQYADAAAGCTVYLSVIVTFDVPTKIYKQRLSETEVKALEKEILQMTKLYICHFEIIKIGVHTEESTNLTSHFQIILQTVSNGKCTYENISQLTLKTMWKPWIQSIAIGNKSMPTIGRIDFYNAFDQYSTSLDPHTTLLYRSTRGPKSRCHHRMGMFMCPHVILNESDYNLVWENILGKSHRKLEDNMTVTTTLYDGFYPLSRDDIAVCTDTFLRLTSNAVSKFYGSTWHLITKPFLLVLVANLCGLI